MESVECQGMRNWKELSSDTASDRSTNRRGGSDSSHERQRSRSSSLVLRFSSISTQDSGGSNRPTRGVPVGLAV